MGTEGAGVRAKNPNSIQSSIVMLFSAFTSAFIVQKASGNWYSFPIPTAYFFSTAVILICSVVLHISYKAFVQKNDGSKTKPLKDTVNCLNVDIPGGYWDAARKSTKIVSKSNLRLDLKNPANQLKANICKILDANIDYLEKLMR